MKKKETILIKEDPVKKAKELSARLVGTARQQVVPDKRRKKRYNKPEKADYSPAHNLCA